MSDNVFKFPKRDGLDVEVSLEEMEHHMEKTDAVYTMLQMHIEGIVNSSDVDWEHVMDAALSLAIGAGLKAGFSVEELEEGLSKLTVEEISYDA